MCLGAFPACMPVHHHVYAGPVEETGTGTPETEVIDGCELLCGP